PTSLTYPLSLHDALPIFAHMHLSWLDPHKMRKITVVGREKMAVFDDMELEHKVTVYVKAPEQPTRTHGEWQTRTGAKFSPEIPKDRKSTRLNSSHQIISY